MQYQDLIQYHWSLNIAAPAFTSFPVAFDFYWCFGITCLHLLITSLWPSPNRKSQRQRKLWMRCRESRMSCRMGPRRRRSCSWRRKCFIMHREPSWLSAMISGTDKTIGFDLLRLASLHDLWSLRVLKNHNTLQSICSSHVLSVSLNNTITPIPTHLSGAYGLSSWVNCWINWSNVCIGFSYSVKKIQWHLYIFYEGEINQNPAEITVHRSRLDQDCIGLFMPNSFGWSLTVTLTDHWLAVRLLASWRPGGIVGYKCHTHLCTVLISPPPPHSHPQAHPQFQPLSLSS